MRLSVGEWCRSLVALVESQPSHAAVEIRAIGLERPRGLGDVSPRLRERRRDQRALEVVEGVVEGSSRGGDRGGRRRPLPEHRADVGASTVGPLRMLSRSTRLASSRTLPGQAYAARASSAAGVNSAAWRGRTRSAR